MVAALRVQAYRLAHLERVYVMFVVVFLSSFSSEVLDVLSSDVAVVDL